MKTLLKHLIIVIALLTLFACSTNKKSQTNGQVKQNNSEQDKRSDRAIFKPKTWSLQYNEEFVERDVDACIYDLHNYSEEQIKSLKCFAIGYFSFHYESWRPDSGNFTRSCLSHALPGWEGETVIEASEKCVKDTFKNVIKPRIDLAIKKGFKGIDPDNLDQLKKKYAIMLYNLTKDYAHSKGLIVGQKNSYSWRFEIERDFYMSEQCHQYDICQGILDLKVPVMNLEYYDWTCKKARKNPIVYTVKKQKSGSGSMGNEREICAEPK